MKTKLIHTLIIIIICTAPGFAQVQKGSFMLGGHAYYTNLKTRSGSGSQETMNHAKTGTFDVSVGYAIKDNHVLGVIASYSDYKLNFNSNVVEPGSQAVNTKAIGAFYRIYRPLGNKFYVYGQAAGTYSNSKETTINTSNNSMRIHAGTLSVSPGISYEILRNVQVELTIPNLVSLSYARSKSNANADPERPSGESFRAATSLNSGLLSNLGIGFKIFIP